MLCCGFPQRGGLLWRQVVGVAGDARQVAREVPEAREALGGFVLFDSDALQAAGYEALAHHVLPVAVDAQHPAAGLEQVGPEQDAGGTAPAVDEVEACGRGIKVASVSAEERDV